MARHFSFPVTSSSSSSFPVPIVLTVLATLCVFSMVMYLCASHKQKEKEKEGVFSKTKQQASNLFSRFTKGYNKSISSKGLLKIISSRKRQVHEHGVEEEDDDEYYSEEDAVWMKTIIKGEKCRPLDFSGKIEYDSQGNLLPPTP